MEYVEGWIFILAIFGVIALILVIGFTILQIFLSKKDHIRCFIALIRTGFYTTIESVAEAMLITSFVQFLINVLVFYLFAMWKRCCIYKNGGRGLWVRLVALPVY